MQPYLGRLVGKPQAGPWGGRRTIAYRVGIFLAAVYGGYFGAGLGIMRLAVLGVFIQDGLQRLNALKGVLSLLINVVSGVYFALFGPVVWIAALVMASGSLLGGQFGVRVARRLLPALLRGVIVAFGAIVALSLVFG